MPTNIKVFGNIKDVSRFAKRCTITIKLLNGPIAEDPSLIVPTELVKQTDENGYFEAQLGLGDYGLYVGSDQILFAVTDLDSGDKNVVGLITTDITYTKQNYVSNWNGLRQGNLQFLYVPAPKVFTGATFDSGGAHLPGLDGSPYRYFCTFLTALGETTASPFFDIDLTGIIGGDGNCVRLTFNVADVIANVTKRRVWRSTSDEFQAFQVIAELAPTVATFEDVLPYGGYAGGVAPIPDHNTTAGALYASNVKVAQVSPESGFDFPFRVLLPYASTLAFDREATLDLTTDDGVGVPLLRFRKNEANWTVGKVFAGKNAPGIVPNPNTGYTGTRVLQEDGEWVEPSGGGGEVFTWTADHDTGGHNLIGASHVGISTPNESLSIDESTGITFNDQNGANITFITSGGVISFTGGTEFDIDFAFNVTGDISTSTSYYAQGSQGYTGTLSAAIAASKSVIGGIIV